jgi:hypothetical protein
MPSRKQVRRELSAEQQITREEAPTNTGLLRRSRERRWPR